jgi:tetratricopeptide (TPR) repeat protein
MGLERLRLTSGEPPEEALRRHQEALPGARERGDRRAEAIHLGEAARALAFLQRYAEAIAANEESIALYRALEDAHGEAICLTNLGAAAYAFDLRPATVAYWRRALDKRTALPTAPFRSPRPGGERRGCAGRGVSQGAFGSGRTARRSAAESQRARLTR